MPTVPALQAALNNANKQLTQRNLQLDNANTQLNNLKTQLTNLNTSLVLATRELYAPTALSGIYFSLNPLSFSGLTQIMIQVPGEEAHYDVLWCSSWPRQNLFNVQYDMYGHDGTRIPGLYINNVEVQRGVVVWHTVGGKKTWVTFPE